MQSSASILTLLQILPYLRFAQAELQHLQGLADHVGLLLHQDALLILLEAAQRAQQALQDGVMLLLQGLQALDHLLGPGDDLILGQLLPRVLLLLHAHHGGHVLAHPAQWSTGPGLEQLLFFKCRMAKESFTV